MIFQKHPPRQFQISRPPAAQKGLRSRGGNPPPRQAATQQSPAATQQLRSGWQLRTAGTRGSYLRGPNYAEVTGRPPAWLTYVLSCSARLTNTRSSTLPISEPSPGRDTQSPPPGAFDLNIPEHSVRSSRSTRYAVSRAFDPRPRLPISSSTRSPAQQHSATPRPTGWRLPGDATPPHPTARHRYHQTDPTAPSLSRVALTPKQTHTAWPRRPRCPTGDTMH